MNKGKQAIRAAIVAMLVLMTACGKTDGGNDDASDENGDLVVVTAVRDQDASIAFKEGEDFDNNAYTRAYQDELGIKLKYDWIVPADQYDAKLNVAIASRDLPDIFKVNATQLQQLVEAGLVADLTGVYEEHASDLTRTAIEMGPEAKASATFDGKLMALPPDGNYDASLSLLYLRSDWLKKLNLEAPRTFEELENIIRAFKTQDPDGNGKDDTYGIALTKDLYDNGVGEATGIFNAFHAYPNIWLENGDGQLVYGSIQPEMKAALAKLQQWYKEGLIDREFGVKDNGKVGEDFAANKVGVNFGALWNPLWPMQDGITANPDSDWMTAHNVSVDDKPVRYSVPISFNTYMVANKNFKHPEALIQLFNLGNEKLAGGEADPKVYHSETVGDKTYEHFKEHVIQGIGGDPTGGNYVFYELFTEALNTGDTSKLKPDQKKSYDSVVKFTGGDRSDPTIWGFMRVFGTASSFKIIDEVYQDKESNLMLTKFFGGPTKTMVEKKATLDKLQLETFTNIILGDSIDTFDQFVSDWKKLGGDAITAEVNAWYADNK